ncbi:MAG: TerD family protein [Candidatus Competibacteraceae bacterium]|nr:MAG: TerD family protein [Candidatus Competibacteraceae bacterium]
MKELIKGANAPLATSGKIRIHLSWRTAPSEIDFACFALDAREQVPSDPWFLFYNQPSSPNGAIRFDSQHALFLVNLNNLPVEIRKCVFTATLNDGHFESVDNFTLEATAAAGSDARFRLAEPVSGRSLLIAELYRYGDLWKIRAKGDGLKHDLAVLARTFGVDVMDEENRDEATSAQHSREPVTRRPAPVPAPVPKPTPAATAGTTPTPTPDSVPLSSPVPVGPLAPAPPHDRHEKLKTYATLAIAFGSLTTAITTLVTQCAPHPSVVMIQPATTPTMVQQPATTPDPNPNSSSGSEPALNRPHSPQTSWNNRGY